MEYTIALKFLGEYWSLFFSLLMEEKSVQDELSLPILLADRVIKSALEAELSRPDCIELSKLADRISHKLRSAARLACAATQPVYDRPIRRVSADVSKNLERAFTLVRKCTRSGFLRQVFTMTVNADFRKVSSLLDASIADVSWLQSVLDPHEGSNLSLPPIAKHDPILAMLWSSIASVQMGHLHDQIDAANNLATLAHDNDRNKQMIVEEGGVVPLLRLLKEGASSEAQVAAATALLNLGNDHERVQCIASELAIPMIVQVLGDSPIRVQIAIANLAAKMAEMDPTVQEELGKVNIIRHLVTLLSMDVGFDDPEHQLNKDPVKDPLKFELKASCAKVLWKLSKGSLLNSRKITETKGLLILAKLIEKDQEELQVNCLMALMEITLVAESNSELRRTAFKPNSPAAEAVLEQLLRVINTETSQQLLIPSMRSIGALSRTFPAKETRMIKPLVAKLAHRNTNVAVEATIALIKFTSPEDYNCKAHSKAMVDFEGVPKLMNLIRTNGRDQVNEVVLLCYLALHVGNNKAFEQAQALGFLQKTARSMVAHHPELRDLFTKALHHLTLYQTGEHTLGQANEP